MESLETALLQLLHEPNYRPAKPKILAKRLGLDEEQQRDLKRLIKRLVKRGTLAFGPSHLVQLPSDKPVADRLIGSFRRNESGFGYVHLPPRPGQAAANEIYISAADARDAATGDRVVVRLRKQVGPKGQPAGAIVEILERQTNTFVGEYFEDAETAFVKIDGRVFASPISVGDPGVKGARPGDKVVVEMVQFPSHVHDGEGVITEVLGPRGEPGVDTLSIIREFNLPDAFPEEVLAEAREVAARFDESIGPDREDLTATTVITIDPVDARDFDDAISLEMNERGHWVLGVHIADVAHFVQPKSAIDRQAYHRGTSVYLPDRVLPMLPELLSNGLASLQPDRVRYTKTVFLEFTPEGQPVHTRPANGAIRSARRFTYEEVDDFLADRSRWEKQLTPAVFALLDRMHRLAMILRKRRLEQGALELNMREVKIDLDQDGRVTGAHCVENTVSHQIIEEFMLAANEAVAELLFEADWPFLRRVHPSPDPRKLRALTQFVDQLGFSTESLENRFALQKLLNEVAHTPQAYAVHYAALRSLQRAVYSPAEEGHYALASDCYCHFTSPIRRYPDLTIHRLLEAKILGKRPRIDEQELGLIGDTCSDRERRAEAAERELTRVKLLHYLSSRIGEELEAVITGVEEFGLFVQGVDLPAEGLIHISSLRDDFYRFDRTSHTLTGNRQGNTFRLGDLVQVVVARVDDIRRELDFRLVAGGENQRRASRPAKGTKGAHPKQRPGKNARNRRKHP